MSQISDDNYFVVNGWMINKLNLSRYAVCSECGANNRAGNFKYCFDCGAKMEGYE